LTIKVRHNGLEIDGNLLPLVSGSVQYWRLDPEKWPLILDQVKALGFGVIETYLPWSIHEVSEGEFDFGRKNPSLDLDRFLSLAAERGLKVLVRPGPHINAELTDFGFPERVLQDPKLWARDAYGNPAVLQVVFRHLPLLSYANEELFSQFERYLAALCPILLKHLHPHGPIVAMQVDNETGYFFHLGTYDLDYCEASQKLFRHFLGLKHRQIKNLNAAYQTSYASFDEVPLPLRNTASSPEGLAPFLDWAAYKEYYLQWGLNKLADLYRSKGLGQVPFYQNYFNPVTTPFNIPDTESDQGIDFCGIDGYPHRFEAGGVAEKASYLNLSSHLAYVPEYGAGAWPHWLAPDQGDTAGCILAPFMGGARGVNFYMLVERERWVGSPISRHGVPRPELTREFSKLNSFLKQQEWHESSPQFEALLLHSRESQLTQASFQRPGMGLEAWPLPEELHAETGASGFFGPGTGPAELKAFLSESRNFLRESQLGWGLVDSAVSTDKLKRARLVLTACWGWMEEATARKLIRYVEEGGLLVLGPGAPVLNGKLEKLKAFEEALGGPLKPGEAASQGDGKLLVLSAFDAKAVQGLLNKARVRPELSLSDRSLELQVHRLKGRQVLFARNPHGESRTCAVLKEGKFVLKPLWSSGKFLGAVEEREVALDGGETKIWEVIPC
jgi:beta-galactosidase